MKINHLLTLTYILPLIAVANTPEPTSALAYQQTTNTRIAVEESHLRFFTGGSERMTIDANGYVGIGTTSPVEKLSVLGGLLVKGRNLDSQDLNHLYNSGALLVGWNRSRGGGETNMISNRGLGSIGGFEFRDIDNSGTERLLMKIEGNGNVGIGTSNPDNKLEVNGSSLFLGSVKLNYGGVAKGQALLYFFDRSSSGDASRNWKIATLPASTVTSGDKILIEVFGGNHDSKNTFQSTIHLANRSGFRGYVRSLFGTRHSSVRIRAYSQNDGSVDVYLSILSPSWKGASVRVYEGSAINYSSPTIYQNPENVGDSPSGTLVFDSYSTTPGMAVNNSGNLHAATYSADSPPNWPDYVFEDSYELNELDQVEKYIEENHHLPEIPSAAEVAVNGIDIVDMQAKLLQKIEELTLYVIDQNKKIESQSTLLEEQQKQIEELKSNRPSE